MHKGFKCLEISIGHIYISHDVIFDESIFSFVSLHPTTGAYYHSDILLEPPTVSGDNIFTNVHNVSTLPVMSASDSCVQLPDPLLQNTGVGPVTGVLPDGLPPLRDQQRTVPDATEHSSSWRTATGPDSCASPTGPPASIPSIIGNQGASTALETPPVPNPPGVPCLPINVVTGALPLHLSEPMTQLRQLLCQGPLAHLLRFPCRLQYHVAQAYPSRP
jgi:hypothetical protein